MDTGNEPAASAVVEDDDPRRVPNPMEWSTMAPVQEEMERQVRDVLGDAYRSYEVAKYMLTEDIREGSATIVCQFRGVDEDKGRAVEGTGVGMIDALFQGLKAALATDFPSVEHIHFVDFSVTADFQAPSNEAHSDAPGHVRLVVENSDRRRFVFEQTSPSVTASCVQVVVKAIEHFVNAELAVMRVYDWISDARKRHRPELVERYTRRLSELVKNATYSEAIERYQESVGV